MTGFVQPSRLIIAGPRDVPSEEADTLVYLGITAYFLQPGLIVEGGAKGIDRAARRYAMKNWIPFETYEADWKNYGNAAGPRRNRIMAERADSLLLVWTGKSRGSASMLRIAKEHKLQIFEHIYQEWW